MWEIRSRIALKGFFFFSLDRCEMQWNESETQDFRNSIESRLRRGCIRLRDNDQAK